MGAIVLLEMILLLDSVSKVYVVKMLAACSDVDGRIPSLLHDAQQLYHASKQGTRNSFEQQE